MTPDRAVRGVAVGSGAGTYLRAVVQVDAGLALAVGGKDVDLILAREYLYPGSGYRLTRGGTHGYQAGGLGCLILYQHHHIGYVEPGILGLYPLGVGHGLYQIDP